MMVSPLAMSCTAYTPLPWMPDWRTWILRVDAGLASVGLADVLLGTVKIWYRELVWVRVCVPTCVCARVWAREKGL